MLSKVEKDFVKAQVDNSIVQAITMFGVTGFSTGKGIISASFIKGQLKRRRISTKKMDEIAKALRDLGCVTHMYGRHGDVSTYDIEYSFDLHWIPLSVDQCNLFTAKLAERKKSQARKESPLVIVDLEDEPIPMFKNPQHLDITAKFTISDDDPLKKFAEETKKRLDIIARRAYEEMAKILEEYKKGIRK